MQIQVNMGKRQNHISKTHCLPLCQPYFKENLWEFKKVESQRLHLVDTVVCYLVELTSQFPRVLAAEYSHLSPLWRTTLIQTSPCSSRMAHTQHQQMVTEAWPTCLSSGHLWVAIQFQSYAQACWRLSCITVPRLSLPSSALHGCCPQEPSQ